VPHRAAPPPGRTSEFISSYHRRTNSSPIPHPPTHTPPHPHPRRVGVRRRGSREVLADPPEPPPPSALFPLAYLFLARPPPNEAARPARRSSLWVTNRPYLGVVTVTGTTLRYGHVRTYLGVRETSEVPRKILAVTFQRSNVGTCTSDELI